MFVVRLLSYMNFNQLGMMGTSVLYSSGDDGVAGGNGLCLNSEGSSIFISFICVYFDWAISGQVTESGTRFTPDFPVGKDHISQTIPSHCFFRLLVHSLLQLGPPRSTLDQPLMTQKGHASKLFSLEEDSLTSLREGSTMEFLQLLFNFGL